MRQILAMVLLLAAGSALADKTILTIPPRGKISFEAPATTKIKEGVEAGRYQYLASSVGQADERFAIVASVEPTVVCGHGKSTKDITRCFLESTDQVPGIVKESRNTECSDKSCTVVYMASVREGDIDVRYLHVNLLFAYRKGLGHVDVTVRNPTEDDVIKLLTFPSSLTYSE